MFQEKPKGTCCLEKSRKGPFITYQPSYVRQMISYDFWSKEKLRAGTFPHMNKSHKNAVGVLNAHKTLKCMLLSFTAHFFPFFISFVLFQRIFGMLQIDRCLFKSIAVQIVVFRISGFSLISRELCCYSSNTSQGFVGNLKLLMDFDRLISLAEGGHIGRQTFHNNERLIWDFCAAAFKKLPLSAIR